MSRGSRPLWSTAALFSNAARRDRRAVTRRRCRLSDCRDYGILMPEVLGGLLAAYAVVALKDDRRVPVQEEQRIVIRLVEQAGAVDPGDARSSSVRTSTSSTADRSGAVPPDQVLKADESEEARAPLCCPPPLVDCRPPDLFVQTRRNRAGRAQASASRSRCGLDRQARGCGASTPTSNTELPKRAPLEVGRWKLGVLDPAPVRLAIHGRAR